LHAYFHDDSPCSSLYPTDWGRHLLRGVRRTGLANSGSCALTGDCCLCSRACCHSHSAQIPGILDCLESIAVPTEREWLSVRRTFAILPPKRVCADGSLCLGAAKIRTGQCKIR
jgi:hypothetical protein